MSLDHPRLINTEPESIRSFLLIYDQYISTFLARSRQLTPDTLEIEAIKPVDLNVFMDVEFLDSNIALWFIPDAIKYEDLTNIKLRQFLEDLCKKSKETIALEKLDTVLKHKLLTKLRNKNETETMQEFFTSFHTILVRNGFE